MNAQTQVPATAPAKKDVRSLLQSEDIRRKIGEVLPKYLTPERFTRVALATVLRTPELGQCSAESLLEACMRCAQAGLEPDGHYAHLIPFGQKVQVIFDYKGLQALARRNGVDSAAFLVHEKDDFLYMPDDGNGKTVVKHSVNPREDRGPIVGAYSRAKSDGKDPDYEWMSIAEIQNIRKRSKAANKGPWVTDFNEMAKKCPLRRHSKRWPMDNVTREAMQLDDDGPDPLKGTVTDAVPTLEDAPKSPSAQETGTDTAQAPRTAAASPAASTGAPPAAATESPKRSRPKKEPAPANPVTPAPAPQPAAAPASDSAADMFGEPEHPLGRLTDSQKKLCQMAEEAGIEVGALIDFCNRQGLFTNAENKSVEITDLREAPPEGLAVIMSRFGWDSIKGQFNLMKK